MGCLHPDKETESPKLSGKTSNSSITEIMEQDYPQNMPLSTFHGVSGLKCFWMKAIHKVGMENVNFFGKVMVNLQEINGLKEKVADLERELQKQIQLKETYHSKAMTLQRDIRELLNIAQEHGFIHLIVGNASTSSSEDPHESIEESETEHVPNYPTSCLVSLRQQAIQNGWQINECEIELHEQIGKGATADIFRGTWRGLDVAVKCIRPEYFEMHEYLHEQKPKVLHRDLKLSNILLDDNHHAKLGDFGHARFLASSEFALTGETGTYVYMAPEVIKSQPYDEKCDVYSYAIILNELVTGLPPYIDSKYPPPKIAYEVAEGNLRPTLPKHESNTSNVLINLICCAWDTNPLKRPTFESITYIMKQIKEDNFE